MPSFDTISTLPSTSSSSTTRVPQHESEFNIYYVVCEVLVAIFAVIGNALVIFVFFKERRLRRRTNYYIFSLALADFLVGLLGIPFAIMASLGITINLYACLFTVSLLVVLCTISIFCLVAVSVDRYWAILHPMGYSRNVRTKTALVIISICWFAGAVVGFLPLMGWHSSNPTTECYFLGVMDYHYLVFLYFGTIITPAILLAGFYAHIYQVVVKQLRQIVTMHPEKGKSGSCGGGTMIRMLGVAQTNEVKATQNLAIIVLFFMICWIPLYTINCVIAFVRDIEINRTFLYCCIILSHLNSAGNPLLYAYHLRDFRLALKNFFCGLVGKNQYVDQLNRNFVSNNNYSKIRYKKDASPHSSVAAINKFAAPKISKIVKNSTAVVAATAGEMNRDIWNIPEDDSGSSESSANHDKMLMIRPATPYRNFMQMKNNSEVNKGFLDNLSIDSDDVFNEDTLPYHDYVFEDYEVESCLSDSLMKNVKVQVQVRESERRTHSLSSSSPQLTKGLFLVDREVGRPVRSASLIETLKSDKDGVKLNKKSTDNSSSGSENAGTVPVFPTFSPLKVVHLLRYNRRRKSFSRSLSVDEGHVSMESLHRKSSDNCLTNSCGS